jgi:flagellar biosynthesis protein FlhB
LAEDQEERTEQATDQRREDFRKRGQVAMTRELGTAALILISAGVLYVFGRYFSSHLAVLFEKCMSGEFIALVKDNNVSEILLYFGQEMAFLLAPIFGISIVIGVMAQLLQTGFLQVEDALSPNLDKLNPLTALGRIFSMKGVIEIVKSILKIAAIFLVIYFLLKKEFTQVPYISGYSVGQIMSYLGTVLFKLLLGTGLFMLVLSLVDYFVQRWQLEKEMMMTKQEIKEEHKSREGDPLIKARIRKIQREVAQRKMLQEIPKASVVVTNPTHIACVLKYSDTLPAPQLVAMGADFMAETIKKIAREHNIPILENKPLARTIFKTMKVGQIIPRELFVAVAEVLSYVMRLKRKKNKKKTAPMKDKGL